ncbi:MAG: hypothetical protein ACFE9D_02765 [Promethearchaeota archaeon]
MPSKRTSAIIGIWVIVAVLVIVDALLFSGLLLDSLFPGLNGITNVLIFALIPFAIASALLDRRTVPELTNGPSRRLPQGARSVSGQPMESAHPKPRIKRDKRAEQLETIIVEPGANATILSNASNSASPPPIQSETSSSRYLRSRRTSPEETAEMDKQVKEQLDAIELEMAKLEEQLEQNGIAAPASNINSAFNSENAVQTTNTVTSPTNTRDDSVSSEEATSELQAIDELLARLEQRKRAGGVEEETYQRLREKYLKRRSELA